MLPGFPHALQTFRCARRTVPAYAKFLSQHAFRTANVRSVATFATIPLTDKKNYIHAFPLLARCPRATLPPILYASSGSSGVPSYWYSDAHAIHRSGLVHEHMLRDWHIHKKERTLVVVCFSMGVWIAGQHTRDAFLEAVAHGYRLTVIAPGYAKEDILTILSRVAPSYDNLILAGHPPFIMDVVQEARRRRIPFPSQKTFFLTAGDAADESWRDSIMQMVAHVDPFRTVINAYGSTDAGIMAHETPATIRIRRAAQKRKSLMHALFGDGMRLPALFQYHPEHIYFEEDRGELILTAATPTPLVRYNIHDRGRVIPYHNMISLLMSAGAADLARSVRASGNTHPFLAVYGRGDVAATFYALHIYPEHINAGLKNARSARLTTGSYLSYTKSMQKGRSQEFHIELELAKGVKAAQKVEDTLRESIVNQLTNLNIEYRKLHEWIGARALPKLHLHPFGSQALISRKVKGFLSIIGKKARMITF